MRNYKEKSIEPKPFLSTKLNSNTFGKQTYSRTYDTSKFSNMSESLQNMIKFEFLFKEIYERIKFFEKPDIIPYPLDDFLKSLKFEENLFDRTKINPISATQSLNSLKIDSKRSKIDSENSNKKKKKKVKKNTEPEINRSQMTLSPNPIVSKKSSANSRKSTPFNANSKRKNNLADSSSRLSRKSREKSSQSRGSSKSREKYRNEGSFENEIGCDTCIRLHKHLWARPEGYQETH